MRKQWCLLMVLLGVFVAETGYPFDKTFIHGYYGQVADMSMRNMFSEPDRITDFQDGHMITLGYGVENMYWEDRFSFGGEVNGTYHWGYKHQELGEFSAALFVRWYKFPWAWKIPQSITIGDGLSYVTDYPQYELDFGGNESGQLKEKWLNFFFIEIAFGMTEKMDLFVRLHHRCTAWGLIGSPNEAGSTFPSLGLRYTF